MTPREHTLESLHQIATDIFRQALDDCRIDSAFDRHLRFEGTQLHRPLARRGEQSVIDFKNFKRVYVIAIGKAAVPMLEAFMTRMPRRKGLRGICCSASIPDRKNWRIRYFEGGHPLPTEGSFAAARATLALLRKARKDTVVLFLISGGASALFDLPLDPAISLEDTMAFHQALVASGAPITEINTIRKHFSAVKGGRLAIAADEAVKLSILLPDVPLRSLDVLASGPTYPDHTTVAEALRLIDQYHLRERFPKSVNNFFDRPEQPPAQDRTPQLDRTDQAESATAAKGLRAQVARVQVAGAQVLPRIPWRDGSTATSKKPGPSSTNISDPAFQNSSFEILLSSNDLVENARMRAIGAGYYAVVDNSCDDWDYADASAYLLKRFHEIRAEHPRCCLISGGEVTVTLDRTPGAGGRNQQFALKSALELANYPGQPFVVFSAGSDGIDGNTRAAGAIADTSTVRRATNFGYNPVEALKTFNACPLFTALGDTVPTGPTSHNLRDLRLLIDDSNYL